MYLRFKKARIYRDVPLVKILAGIRRSGKSTILEMLGEELVPSNIPQDHTENPGEIVPCRFFIM